MLGKMIKYDMKAMSRTMIPFLLTVFGIALLGTIVSKAIITLSMDSPLGTVIKVVLFILSALIIIALCAAAIVGMILIVRQYYNSMMTDEGYFTLTLPATSTVHISSKLITALIWSIISVALVVVCVAIYTLFGTASTFISKNFIQGIKELMSQIAFVWNLDMTFITIETIVLCIVGLIFHFLEIYLAITIGGMVAKKHKVLAAVGFYFIINCIFNIISVVILTVLSISIESTMLVLHTEMEFLSYAHPMMTVWILGYLIGSVILFILCWYLLKNKLNLE